MLQFKGRPEELPLNIPSSAQVDKLERELEEYRTGLVSDEHIYCGEDLVSGFSDAMVKEIVEDCNVEFTFSGFIARYNFPSHQMACDIWSIVCTTLGRDVTLTSGISHSVDSDSEEFETWSDSEFQEAVIRSDSDDD